MVGRMFVVDVGDMHEARRKLEIIKRRAVPHAARSALNELAFDARKEWQSQLGKKLILRNTWTARSIRVKKASGTHIPTMEARVGSVQPYLRTQEDGGTVSSKGRYGVTIPTSVASGQGQGVNPRARPVRRRNWMTSITLPSRGGGSARQKNARAVSMALKSGKRTAFVDLGKRKGIVRLVGPKKKPKVRMIWDMSKRSVRIKPTPTLEPTLVIIKRKGSGVARRALVQQINRALR